MGYCDIEVQAGETIKQLELIPAVCKGKWVASAGEKLARGDKIELASQKFLFIINKSGWT